ncbi:MAG TPA: FAD-binding protein, partial [Paraburkholderia sp.]|uniref:FAD-binding protein n=1 Tax=Paraburkholderia sp. TaxID=1926495 RepID=UPI002B48D843
ATVRRLVRERGTGRVLGVEVWQLPPGGEQAARHAKLNRLANRWRNYRAAKAEQWRIQAAQIERAEAAPRYIRAERAVILAAGGFVFNRQMVKEHAPRYTRGWKNGHAGCDGSGIRLGLGSGAQAAHLSNVSAWRFITPPYAWPRAVVVNSRGERFCNEEVYGATLGYEMVEHQDGRAWIVFDARLRRQAIWQCLSGRLWAFQALPALMMMLFGAKHARTIDKLAARIGADPQTLLATFRAYNASARGECTDALGKLPETRAVLDKAPFYAVDLSIGAPMFPLATITTGGLKVNEADGHVLDAHGEDIPGLFAAGRTAIGIPSSRYMSGTSLADCVFSGRRAGRAAAFEFMEQ